MESKCSGVCAQTTACSSSSFESTVWFSQRKRIARHAFRLWPAPTFAGTPLSRTCRLRTGTAEKISRKIRAGKWKQFGSSQRLPLRILGTLGTFGTLGLGLTEWWVLASLTRRDRIRRGKYSYIILYHFTCFAKSKAMKATESHYYSLDL